MDRRREAIRKAVRAYLPSQEEIIASRLAILARRLSSADYRGLLEKIATAARNNDVTNQAEAIRAVIDPIFAATQK